MRLRPFRLLLAAWVALAWLAPPGLEVLVCRGTPVAVQRVSAGCRHASCCGCCARRAAAPAPADPSAKRAAPGSCGCCVSVPLPNGGNAPAPREPGREDPDHGFAGPALPAGDLLPVFLPPAVARAATGPPGDARPPAPSFPLPLRV